MILCPQGVLKGMVKQKERIGERGPGSVLQGALGHRAVIKVDL